MKEFIQILSDLVAFCLTILTTWLILKYPDYIGSLYLLFGISLLLFHISRFLFFEILVLFVSIFIGFLCIYFFTSSAHIIIMEMLILILWYALLMYLDGIREKKQILFFEEKENLEKNIGKIKYDIEHLKAEIQKNLIKIQNYKIVEEIINKLSSFTTFEEITSFLSDIFIKLFPQCICKICIENYTKQISEVEQKILSLLEKDVLYVFDLSTYSPFSLEPHKFFEFYQIKQYLLKNKIQSFVCIKLYNEKRNSILGYLIFYSKYKIKEESYRLMLFLSSYVEIAISNIRLYESVKELAITDSLTGLYVQRYFKELLNEKIKIYKYYKKPISLAMFDIDNFKQINDTYGHNVGDEVLIKFASILTSRLRETDIIARYGGDEFVVVFPNTDLDKAKNICEEIRNLVIKEPVVVHKNITSSLNVKRVKFFVSCGVGMYSEKFATIEEFIDYVDKLLYKAKQCGKNKVVWE